MIKNILPGVYVETEHERMDWFNARFIPCEVLFPNWAKAREELEKFVARITNFIVCFEDNNIRIYQVNTTLANTCTCSFEEGDKVVEIYNKLVQDYVPDLDCFIGTKINGTVITEIKHSIKHREFNILCNGGRPWRDELCFRLGVRAIG